MKLNMFIFSYPIISILLFQFLPLLFFLRTKTTTNIGTLQATMSKRSDQTAMDELELKVKSKRSLICAFAKAA